MKYTKPISDVKYPQYFPKLDPRLGRHASYYTLEGHMSPVQGHFCKVLEIKPGTAAVQQDILLERASALTVKMEDAEGKPVSGAWAAGIGSENIYPAVQIKEASCAAYGLEGRKPRLLVFYEPKKKLVAARTLKGDEKSPVVVQLRPAAAVKGRLLDADGQALAAVVGDVVYRDREAQHMHQLMHETKQILTDAAGAFTLDELIPELKLELTFRHGKQKLVRETKPAEATIQLKPGDTRDLGTLKLKQEGTEP